jgi:hypothetical protein
MTKLSLQALLFQAQNLGGGIDQNGSSVPGTTNSRSNFDPVTIAGRVHGISRAAGAQLIRFLSMCNAKAHRAVARAQFSCGTADGMPNESRRGSSSAGPVRCRTMDAQSFPPRMDHPPRIKPLIPDVSLRN